MFYLILFAASSLSCGFGFISEITRGNIRHLKDGREPNAGAAIFPTIPLIPLFYVLVVFLLNMVVENIGWHVIFLYLILSNIYRVWEFSKLNREFNDLNESRKYR